MTPRPFSPTRIPSPSSSSGDESDSPNRALPPNTAPESQYLDGEAPNVLADRALGLHSHSTSRHRPQYQHRTSSNFTFVPPNPHGSSLMSSLFDSLPAPAPSPTPPAKKVHIAEEEEPLLADVEGEDACEDEEEQVPGEEQAPDLAATLALAGGSGRRRGSRSRSKSLMRKLKWYQRPSPIWFLPGTLLMALSMGMIIAPKYEIYTQLVCRSFPPMSSTPTADPIPIGPLVTQMLFGSFAPAPSEGGLKISGWEGGGTGSPESDEEWARQCRSRPEVQKAVVPLATILTLSSGLLSALTTGYWGALSDRRGRKPIIALALFGMLVMDSVFLLVVNYHNIVGYRFLLVGPAFDGMLGGLSTAQAATNAYLSDCTSAGSRAQIFSILGGLLFGGIALGPTLGSLLISISPGPGTVLRPFYVALGMHMLYFILVVVFVPESLSQLRQEKARERWEEEKASRGGWRPWSFLRPLALLLPHGKEEMIPEEDVPILWSVKKNGGRDFSEKERRQRRWALLQITTGYAFYILVISVGQIKIQYTQLKFGWDAVRNGYLLSFAGASRMLVLVAVLPSLIWLFRKPPPLPRWEKPVVSDDVVASEETHDLVDKWEKEARFLRVVHDSHFDLFLARTSILIDLFGYFLMALPGATPITFIVTTFIQGFGGGASPALQSLALAHASPRDTGRLFASLSVLQALWSAVTGPTLFAVVYYATLNFWPEGIFGVAALSYGVSFLALVAVRLGKAELEERQNRNAASAVAREAALVRGRSETRKPATLASDVVLRD